MNKPSTVARQEFIEKQIELINNSGLPAFVLVDIAEETLAELRRLAKDQYEKDKAAWEAFLKEKAETENSTAEETE